MNVTKDNFNEAVQQVTELLPSAEFVAFDEEMTGISLPDQPEKLEDVPAQRYAKMRNVASRYNIIQFGICLFHAKEDGKGYVARPFNFYVFPESGAINMEGSSIGFLRKHSMDFNKWIYEGIPYVNRAHAEKLRPKAEEEKKNGEKRYTMVLSKQADIDATNTAIEGLKAWLADEGKKEQTEYEVMATNPYLRRFLYETVGSQFPSLIAESRPVPGGFRGQATFVVLRLNEAQKKERDEKKLEEKKKEWEQKIGFFRMFEALVNAKKPLIGHNCMYDILFMMSHFEGALPDTYSSFKELFHERFPTMLDTKALATREPFKYVSQPTVDASDTATQEPPQKRQRFGSTALGEVFKVFVEETKAAKESGSVPDISFADGFDRYVGEDNAAAHEAAYDAYMTGFAFAHMAKHALAPEYLASAGSHTPMFKALYDFNLAGPDSLVHAGVYVHVSGLKGRGVKDLTDAFAGIKHLEKEEAPAPLQIRWIDDDNAFAIMPAEYKQKASEFLAINNEFGGLSLTAGDDWFQAQNLKVEGITAGDGEPAAKRPRTS